MGINSDHLIGFLAGLGASALGYHYYKKNKHFIDALIKDVKRQAQPQTPDAMNSMSIEELLLMKERLEDMIAEREAANQPTAEEEPSEEAEAKE